MGLTMFGRIILERVKMIYVPLQARDADQGLGFRGVLKPGPQIALSKCRPVAKPLFTFFQEFPSRSSSTVDIIGCQRCRRSHLPCAAFLACSEQDMASLGTIRKL